MRTDKLSGIISPYLHGGKASARTKSGTGSMNACRAHSTCTVLWLYSITFCKRHPELHASDTFRLLLTPGRRCCLCSCIAAMGSPDHRHDDPSRHSRFSTQTWLNLNRMHCSIWKSRAISVFRLLCSVSGGPPGRVVVVGSTEMV